MSWIFRSPLSDLAKTGMDPLELARLHKHGTIEFLERADREEVNVRPVHPKVELTISFI